MLNSFKYSKETSDHAMNATMLNAFYKVEKPDSEEYAKDDPNLFLNTLLQRACRVIYTSLMDQSLPHFTDPRDFVVYVFAYPETSHLIAASSPEDYDLLHSHFHNKQSLFKGISGQAHVQRRTVVQHDVNSPKNTNASYKSWRPDLNSQLSVPIVIHRLATRGVLQEQSPIVADQSTSVAVITIEHRRREAVFTSDLVDWWIGRAHV
jgi:putative methionine-R-sulfoxide reductase with GAF domain